MNISSLERGYKGFPKSGDLFGGPVRRIIVFWGSIFGSPLFWETTIYPNAPPLPSIVGSGFRAFGSPNLPPPPRRLLPSINPNQPKTSLKMVKPRRGLGFRV